MRRVTQIFKAANHANKAVFDFSTFQIVFATVFLTVATYIVLTNLNYFI